MTHTKTLLAIIVTCSFAAPALAQEPVPVEVAETKEPANSINISPLGVVVGNYAITYERLFGGSHGLIVEGIGSRSSGDDGSSLQFGGGVGYRWHWRGRQNSGFLGIMFAQGFGTGEVTTNASGTEMTHAMTVRSTTVTANVGKRWMFGPMNVTVRFGLGYGHYTVEAKDDSQEAKDAEETLNDILAFLPIGFDGELSVGYTF